MDVTVDKKTIQNQHVTMSSMLMSLKFENILFNEFKPYFNVLTSGG